MSTNNSPFDSRFTATRIVLAHRDSLCGLGATLGSVGFNARALLLAAPFVMISCAGAIAAPKSSTARPLVVRIERQRLVVRPGETFEAKIIISHAGDSALRTAVKVWIEKDLCAEEMLLDQTVTLPPRGQWQQVVSWKPSREEWGCALKASCRDEGGELLAQDCALFSVSENLARTSVIYQSTSSLHIKNDQAITNLLDRFQEQGVTLPEFFTWTPSWWNDWGLKRDCWVSGQNSYPVSRHWLKRFIAAAHQRGMGVLTYHVALHAGSAGFDYVTSHPRSALYDNPQAKIWLSDEKRKLLDEHRAWDAEKQGAFKLFDTVWWTWVNVLDPETFEHGIQTTIARLREYGFDGIRWDGYPLQFAQPGYDWLRGMNLFAVFGYRNMNRIWYDWQGRPVQTLIDDYDKESLRLNKQFNARLRQAIPAALVAYNNWDVDYWKAMPLTTAGLLPGSWVLDETLGLRVGADLKIASPHNRTWEQYRQRVLFAGRKAHQLGAYLHGGSVSWPTRNLGESIHKHAYALLFASGVRPYGVPYRTATDFMQFAFRHSRLLFEPSRWPVPAQYKTPGLSFDVPNTELPAERAGGGQLRFRADHGAKTDSDDLWWREYGYVHATKDTVRLVLHLLNRPKNNEIDPTRVPAPELLNDVKVTAFIGPWKLKNVRVLSPEYPHWAAKPPCEQQGALVTAAVPPFRYWVVFVMDLAGEAAPPKRAPGEKPYP